MSERAKEARLEERYRSLLMQAPTPICVTSGPTHRIDLVNPAYRALAGFDDDVIGKDFRLAHHNVEADYYFQVMDRVFRSGERFSLPQAVIRTRGAGAATVAPAVSTRYFSVSCEPLRDAGGNVDGLMILAVDVTAHVEGRQTLEDAQRRSKFLVDASAALSESLDYQLTLRRVAELAVPSIADWCTVTAVDETGTFQRLVVVHGDPAKRDLAAEYQAHYPPEEHRAGSLVQVLRRGRGILSAVVTDADLVAAAQSEEHLAVMRGLGCTSCIMVPMVVRDETVGVISLIRTDPRRPYGDADLGIAEELAHRAALAIDSARLYREARSREQTMRFLAEASAILSSSLEYEGICQRLARLAVPSFADWCAVDISEEGELKQVAVAHGDPSKVELAAELRRRYPPDPHGLSGAPNVIRTGKSELYEDISDELLVKGARDDEHLRISRELGLKSALVVPLVASGRVLGALSLVWAESGRRYTLTDVALMEELGSRAGLAVENARLFRQVQNAVTLRDEFLSIASHELKTPLTSLQLQIGGMARALARPEAIDVKKLGSRIEFLDRQVDRLSRLVNNLLDVSRASAGRLQLNIEAVDMSRVVREVAERFVEDLASAGCTLTLQVEQPVVGAWDALRLDEIVSNLLANAIRYGAGKPIEVQVSKTDTSASLTVRDHGIGIAPTDQERIFGRFVRAVSADHYGGFGLGLWIVKVLAQSMSGSIQVQSEIDKGSLFTLKLPLQVKNAEATAV